MPELPEVETIARAMQLGERGYVPLPGHTVIDARLLWERTLAEPTPRTFKKRIIGQVIQEVNRRGKFIQTHLSEDVLLIHLRMSGDIRIENSHKNGRSLPLEKHDRLVLFFDNDLRLVFNDTRKFGRAWLVDDPTKVTAKLGPEPLDETFSTEDFYQRLQKHRRQIKPLLMDQHFLAGMGNIYTDEALHLAKLHPLSPSDQISSKQAANLLKAIRCVLQDGIRLNGASIDWIYRDGSFQDMCKVYQHTGEPCQTCGTPIQRILVGQRSTHFCPMCQGLNSQKNQL